MSFKKILTLAFSVCLITVSSAWGYSQIEKRKLPRENVYYEINNDGDDHGNYIEQYYIPVDRANGRKVYCIVYSDKIGESGGGAGISCNWEKFNG